MCTLTFVPKVQSTDFILTSNRDELHTRPTAAQPDWHQYKGKELFFSQDPEGNGTWLGHTKGGRIICLLNGAFELHKRQLPYRMSRGLVVLEALVSQGIDQFRQEFSLEGIEAFTLIWLEGGRVAPRLWELRWDEKKQYFRELSTRKAHIWSSATLYRKPVREKREDWFAHWLEEQKNGQISTKDTLRFHYEGGRDGKPEEAVCMKHEQGATVSITALERSQKQVEYFHHNLRNDKKTLKDWPLEA